MIDNPSICQSDELRTFLSTAEYKSRHFRTVQSIIDNEETLTAVAGNTLKFGAHRLVKFVETAGRKGFGFTSSPFRKRGPEAKGISKRKSRSINSDGSSPSLSPSKNSPERATLSGLKAELTSEPLSSDLDGDDSILSDEEWGASSDEEDPSEDTTLGSIGALSRPVCSLLMELFDMKEQDLYLKQTASAMLLKQYFGGRMTLET